MPEGPGATGAGGGDGDLRARCVALEKAYVHEVYRQLSANSNNNNNNNGQTGTITTQGPPKLLANVTAFLSELEPASVVADVGCGPGRYLSCRPDLTFIGVDACWGMAEQCRQKAARKPHDALCADNLRLPLRDETFDAVLSVAVVHHFASKERRIEALRELARITRIGGRVLITVWAMDGWQSQLDAAGRRFESQDILVPYRQPSICTACQHSSQANNYVQTALLNNLSGSLGSNGGSHRMQKQLRRSCAVSYSTATSEDDCQSERDFSVFNKPRLRRWAFTRGRSLEDSCSSDQSSPSDTCYSFVRRAVQRLSSASSSESRRSYFHRVCRRPWLTDSTDSGTGINVSLSSAERMSESPDLFEEEAHSERHDVSKSESFDSDDLCEDDGFIELRNLDPESPDEDQTAGENPADRVSPLPPTGGLKHRSRSLGDMFSIIPSLLMRSRRRRSARNVDLQKRASTVSDPREYLLRSKDKAFVSRSSSTTSEGFMRFDYFRFLEELSPEGSLNGNSSPAPILGEKIEATEESEPLLRVSDDENAAGTVSFPPPWWMLEPQDRSPAAGVEYTPADTSLLASVDQSVTVQSSVAGTAAAVEAATQHGKGDAAETMATDSACASSYDPGAAEEWATSWQDAQAICTNPVASSDLLTTADPPQPASPQQSEHEERLLQPNQPRQQQLQPMPGVTVVQMPGSSVAPQSQAQMHVDLASRRRLKFQGTRLQEKALRNQFSKKSSFEKLLRRRPMTRNYFSMPNLNVFSTAFNERSPASHLRVLLKRPPAPDLTELELKLGIIDEHGNLKNPLRPAEHRGSFSSHVPMRLPAKRSQSIEVGTGVGACTIGGLPFGALPSLRSALNRRYSLSAVQGNSSSLVPGIPSRSWTSKARHDSLKSDTSVESESDSVISVIYRSKASAGSGSGNGGGGLSDNSIDSEESIVSVIHRSTEETPRAGSSNGANNNGGNRSWQASPLTISQTGSREGSFSSPEYSPTLKSAPLKTEKISCKLWETCLKEVEDEHAADTRTTSPQPQTNPTSTPLTSTTEPSKEVATEKEGTDEDGTGEKAASQDAAEPVVLTQKDEHEKEGSPQLSPSSSSDDAPYISDEEVQCEDIPESFELESTESSGGNAQVDVTRLQPPPTRRMCSPVDPLELEEDVLESIPEEDESCSPIKSPRSKQGDSGTHFPMPTPEQSQQKQKTLSVSAISGRKSEISESTKVEMATEATPEASPAPRVSPALPATAMVTPALHIITAQDAPSPIVIATAGEHRSHRRSQSLSTGRTFASGSSVEPLRPIQQQQLSRSQPLTTVAGDAKERPPTVRAPVDRQTPSDSRFAASSSTSLGGPAKPVDPADKGLTLLHSNVPEQKSSANILYTNTSSNSSCVTGAAVGAGSPCRPFRGLPKSVRQSDSSRRASDVGPQSKCSNDRAKFSPQYSLPEQKRYEKELTASCEQLFRRRPSPQRQQEMRTDPLNELLRGPTKPAAAKQVSTDPGLIGLQQQQQQQQWPDDPRSRGPGVSVSPEPSGFVSRRRTPELRTSPLEVLAQELRSSTDDLYRRAAVSADISQLTVDQSYHERRSSPEKRRTPDYQWPPPDPRFEDANEDAVKNVHVGADFNYWDDWLPQALSRIYAAKTQYDCDELCDQLSDLPDFIPQTTRCIGGRISAEGDILYSDRDSPEDICLGQEQLMLATGLQGMSAQIAQGAHNAQPVASVGTPPTSPEQFSDADESTASTTDQEISDLSSSLERLRISCGLHPEISSGQPLNLNIVIEDFSDQGGSDAEISEACSSTAASSNANQLYVQERQGGSSSLSDHSDRSSASVQTVYKLDTPSKEPSPEVPLELQSTTVDATMDRPIAACDDANVQQEKLSLTSSSSEDSSDENFGDSCCGNITGHSAETYHRYYHVFKQGELESLIEKYVHSLHILKSYYDHSNWCIVAERVQVWTI